MRRINLTLEKFNGENNMIFKLIHLATATCLLTATTANAALHYRFWAGFKRADVTSQQLSDTLNRQFVAETINVGKERGLVAYLPVLPLVESNVSEKIPEELALVIYKSEAHYKAIRNTPEGQAYGAHHWDLFDKDAGSKSFVAETYTGNIESGKAYNLLNSDEDWQQDHAMFNAYSISETNIPQSDQNPEITYVNSVKRFLSGRGMKASIVMRNGNMLYEYQLWQDRATYLANMQLIWSTQLALKSVLQKQKTLTMTDGASAPGLDYGIALQTQFSTKTAETISPEQDALALTARFAEDKSDTGSSDVDGCSVTQNTADTTQISCSGNSMVLVFGGHSARQAINCDFEYTRLSDSLYLKMKQSCE
jgi:hypothetical protein